MSDLELKQELIKQLAQVKEETFTFFWETKSPFSQWHKCSFISKPIDFERIGLPNQFLQPLHFTSAEQYMMLHKALLFKDYEVAESIIKSKDVREQKKFGRVVKIFDDSIWKKFRARIVLQGNKEKFSQNVPLQRALLATKGTTLVEAAPDDNVWGIGLSKDDPRSLKRETWQGLNLLGEILTIIRLEFTGQY